MTKPNDLNTPEQWDIASEGYAAHVAPLLMESFASEFVDRLGVDENTEALEVAAGSGALTETLAKRVKSLLATDFSPGMVDILRKKLIANNKVQVEIMDGQCLSLNDASFDRAACCFGLMLFPDRAKGFSELRRVLRPGGRVMVSGWAGPDRFEGFRLFLQALKAAFPDLPPPPAPLPVFSLSDPLEFKKEMEYAGFIDVEVEFVSRELVFESLDELWSLLTVGAPPVKVLMDQIGVDGEKKLRDALAIVIESEYGRDPIKTINTATVGCAVTPG